MRRHFAIALAVLLTACSPAEESADTAAPSTAMTTSSTIASPTTTERIEFAVASPAFAEGVTIPPEYTCDGEDVSPELNIVGLPPTTRSVTVIVSDPDAPVGTWYHWVEFDIPVAGTSLSLPRDTATVGSAGANSWNLEGYMGPCPPPGEEHRYVFTIYALGGELGLPSGVEASAVIEALDPLLLGSVELSGLYAR